HRAAPGGEKNGYEGSSVTCPHCGGTAEFHSHRAHTALSLVGAVRYHRAYYLCRTCGQGLFPFDRNAGLTTRDLTPALERVATLAGAVADSFEKGADLLEEMSGVRVSEATVERTAEDAGRRLAGAVQAGATFGPRWTGPGTRITTGGDVPTSNLTPPGCGSRPAAAAPPKAAWPTWGWSVTPARNGPGPTRI